MTSFENGSYSYVQDKVKRYEHNAEEIDRTREQAENDCNNYDELAPGTEQTAQEDIEEGAIEAEQFIHFNPDRPTE